MPAQISGPNCRKKPSDDQHIADAAAEIGDRHRRIANHQRRIARGRLAGRGPTRGPRCPPRPACGLGTPRGSAAAPWRANRSGRSTGRESARSRRRCNPAESRICRAAAAPLSGAGICCASAYVDLTRIWAHNANSRAGAIQSRYSKLEKTFRETSKAPSRRVTTAKSKPAAALQCTAARSKRPTSGVVPPYLRLRCPMLFEEARRDCEGVAG